MAGREAGETYGGGAGGGGEGEGEVVYNSLQRDCLFFFCAASKEAVACALSGSAGTG